MPINLGWKNLPWLVYGGKGGNVTPPGYVGEVITSPVSAETITSSGGFVDITNMTITLSKGHWLIYLWGGGSFTYTSGPGPEPSAAFGIINITNSSAEVGRIDVYSYAADIPPFGWSCFGTVHLTTSSEIRGQLAVAGAGSGTITAHQNCRMFAIRQMG